MENRFMSKGKVILVPFPFDDLSTTKVRPAVCLTEPVGSHRHVIVAFVSSQIPEQLAESDFRMDQHAESFSQTGLKVTSVLRLHRLMTVTQSFIRRELGSLTPEWQEEVKEKLRRLFGL